MFTHFFALIIQGLAHRLRLARSRRRRKPVFPDPDSISILMQRPSRTVVSRLPLILLLLALSGCVWLRLLEIKNQLADFDENVRVEVQDRHFILHLLKPVLFSDDFVYLSKLQPSRVENLPGGNYRWHLDFQFDPVKTAEQKSRIVSFIMTYNAERRLAAFDFSPLFVEMAPPVFLEASIRSLGAGKLDQGKRQLKVDPEDLPRLTTRLPKTSNILSVLGPPAEDIREAGLRVLIYRFKATAKPVDPEYEERRLAEARLYFDPVRDELAGLKGKFAGLKLSIDYRRFARRSPGQSG